LNSRRIRGDIIETYKTLSGNYDTDAVPFMNTFMLLLHVDLVFHRHRNEPQGLDGDVAAVLNQIQKS